MYMRKPEPLNASQGDALEIFQKTRYCLTNRRISNAKVVAMQKTREYQTLLYACTQEGCPICRLGQEIANRYLDAWKYELFTDVEVRQMLRRSLGFCHAHTWQLAHMGATLQLAQAYRDIITDTSEQLQGGTEAPTACSGASSILAVPPTNASHAPPATRRSRPRSARSTPCVKSCSTKIFTANSRPPMASAWSISALAANSRCPTRPATGSRYCVRRSWAVCSAWTRNWAR